MTQSNKRPYHPPRQGARPQGRPAAPQQRPMSQQRPASRRQGSAPTSSSMPQGDLLKIIGIGLVAIVLAFCLQRVWPNGFPVVKADAANASAAQEKISEIYSEGPVRINEIMSGNRSTLTLEDGTSPDWIEISNISAKSVSLEGWSLSKTENDVRVFTFPDMDLGAGESVLIHADSRLRDDPAQALHAPFRLSSAGDTLMLFNAGGSAVDTVNVPALTADQSYARMGDYTWQVCATATPGLSNTEESYRALRQPIGTSPVIINELMSTNTSTLKDENGHYYDYVELYNRSGETANLSGWYLTDDEQNLRKWRIPDVSLASGEYLVIFCSKLDRTDDPARLHTNFGLSSEGESLFLVDSQGRVMDRVDFDLLKANVAWSLGSDGSWSSSAAPSPGKAN